MLDTVPSGDWDDYVYEEYVKFKGKANEKVRGFTEEELGLQKNYDYVAFANYSAFQRMAMNSQLLWMIREDVLMPIDFKGLMKLE